LLTIFDAVRQHLQQRRAESPCETNCSKAISRSMPCRAFRTRSGWLGGITVLVLAAAIVLMLGLSVAPNLHERLHSASLHECAVTLIASGSCHHGAAPLMIAPATPLQVSKIPALNQQWVESPFLSACIFEHAPPVRF
jgi:hypothetical protein